MTLPTVMLHVDASDRWPERLELLRAQPALAASFIHAVYGVADASDDPAPGRAASDAFLAKADEQQEAFRNRLAALGGDFAWHTIRTGAPGDVTEQLSANAQVCDVAIMGQTSGRLVGLTAATDTAEQLAVAAGRPVLVVPDIPVRALPFRRAVIAMNGSASAVRSMHDAMPFLKECREVTLLILGPVWEEDGWRWTAMTDHLKRCGISADVRGLPPTDVPISDAILNQVTDLGADLLIMGAHAEYGAPQRVRGSATRDVLRQMTVPVLFSH